ncbi:uncharacterized protein LOC121838229 [Ixodes scapularis]|uniref:uncharacterized protein LOC121838229 n=1 Tax=Ixodes scapularis TaxID=6945 RepID=UPI001C38F7B7|nr:uncharacterized protein LOC121838229 [Ixodes scapularis]
MDLRVPSIPPFDPHADPTSVFQRWIRWHARFENYLVASHVTNDERKRALLLHLAGEAVHDIFITLPNTGTLYETAVEKLKAHFAPKKNAVFERHVFRQAKQEPEETIDQFHVRLRQLALTCEFADVGGEVLSQVIEGTASTKLRRNALREPDVKLERLLLERRSLENAERQAADIERKVSVPVNKVPPKKKPWPRKTQKKEVPQTKTCTCCGRGWPHDGGKEKCPAWGSTCHNCNKKNHFANVCRTRKQEQVRTVQELEPTRSEDVSEELYYVQQKQSKIPSVTVEIEESRSKSTWTLEQELT